MNHLSEEKAKYLSIVNNKPSDVDAWFILAQIYQKQHHKQLAVEAYEKAILLKEDPEFYYRLGELYYNLKTFNKALSNLLKALELADNTWQYTQEVEQLVDELYQNDSCSW